MAAECVVADLVAEDSDVSVVSVASAVAAAAVAIAATTVTTITTVCTVTNSHKKNGYLWRQSAHA
ncbi:hypothetical protein V7128_21590 [Neobacillus vireti]